MNASVIIATANRAADLRDTLENLARIHRPGTVELIVVDNCSTDDTKQVVDHAAAWYPFPVHYLFEQEQGKYAALNSGIKAARGAVIAATDDDARFEPDWLERAVAGLRDHECEFVGGRVLPIWRGPKPLWLNERSSLHAKVIAILDHGSAVREFGRGISWPLGVNVAYRRETFDRLGLFDNRLGRKTGTLRNQAQREWHLRARAFGARGFYLPDMVVHHLVAAARLEKQYFRRWLYWHGISRALLFKHGGFDMEEPELEPPPHFGERRIAGVPLHLFIAFTRTIICRSPSFASPEGSVGPIVASPSPLDRRRCRRTRPLHHLRRRRRLPVIASTSQPMLCRQRATKSPAPKRSRWPET